MTEIANLLDELCIVDAWDPVAIREACTAYPEHEAAIRAEYQRWVEAEFRGAERDHAPAEVYDEATKQGASVARQRLARWLEYYQ